MKGEMSFLNRLEHSEKAGKKWMGSGEIDLMLSILACDGRYEDVAFILPVTRSVTLRDACEAYLVHQKLEALIKENEQMTPAELNKLVHDELDDTQDHIKHQSYLQTKELLIKGCHTQPWNVGEESACISNE